MTGDAVFLKESFLTAPPVVRQEFVNEMTDWPFAPSEVEGAFIGCVVEKEVLMKVFVTGGTGFIGSSLIERMARTEHEVTCLIRKTSNVRRLEKAGVRMVYGDVTDKGSVLEGMRGCDWVANLANIFTYWEPDKSLYEKVNVEGTRNVMESALLAGASKIVHVSTILVYHGPHEGFPEGYPAERTEYYRTRESFYARTKYLADSVCWDLYREEALPLVMVYPGAVLGAGDPKAQGDFIHNLVRRYIFYYLFPDTQFTWVDVKDVAEVIVRALEKPGNIGERYPAGNETMSVREFMDMVCDAAGIHAPWFSLPNTLSYATARSLTLLADTVKKPPLLGFSSDAASVFEYDVCFDGSRTERELGMEFTPVRDAIREEVEWIRAQAKHEIVKEMLHPFKHHAPEAYVPSSEKKYFAGLGINR